MRQLVELAGLMAWTIGAAHAAAQRSSPPPLPLITLLLTAAAWRLGLPVLAGSTDALRAPSDPVQAIVAAVFGATVVLFTKSLGSAWRGAPYLGRG